MVKQMIADKPTLQTAIMNSFSLGEAIACASNVKFAAEFVNSQKFQSPVVAFTGDFAVTMMFQFSMYRVDAGLKKGEKYDSTFGDTLVSEIKANPSKLLEFTTSCLTKC